jgi:hypothetical protein
MKFANVIFIVLLTTGCTTASDIRYAPMELGRVRQFRDTQDRVTHAARRAMEIIGLKLEDEGKLSDGKIVFIGSSGVDWVNGGLFASGVNYGEYVRIAIAPNEKDIVAVSVLAQKKTRFNLVVDQGYPERLFIEIHNQLIKLP